MIDHIDAPPKLFVTSCGTRYDVYGTLWVVVVEGSGSPSIYRPHSLVRMHMRLYDEVNPVTVKHFLESGLHVIPVGTFWIPIRTVLGFVSKSNNPGPLLPDCVRKLTSNYSVAINGTC